MVFATLGCEGFEGHKPDAFGTRPHHGRRRPYHGDFIMKVDSIDVPPVLIMEDAIYFRIFAAASNPPCSFFWAPTTIHSPYVSYITVYGTAAPLAKCPSPRARWWYERFREGPPKTFIDLPHRIVVCQPDGTPLRQIVRLRWKEDYALHLVELGAIITEMERKERSGELLVEDQEVCARAAQTWIH